VKVLYAFLAVLATACSSASFAQEFPTRSIRIVVPYAAGGLPDTMTRLISPHMAQTLGQPVLVENRGGAGAIPGTEVVVRAPADGYTLLMTDVGQVAINPHLFSKLSYDPLKDLVPVGLIGTAGLFLAVHPSLGVNTLNEFVALVKSKPGQYNYGSSGIGSVLHLALEALNSAFGLKMTHVPYKGSGESVPALLAGQVSAVYAALPSISAHVKSGKLKLVATSAPVRSPQASTASPDTTSSPRSASPRRPVPRPRRYRNCPPPLPEQ
jgi:tripartite-type tricarboxylate transporter receptor subunit TctC